MKRRIATWSLALPLVLLIGAQFIPAGQPDNPPAEEQIAASPEVMHILRRSCFDCHSNETRWPWYSRVAPSSWLIRHDVAEGREHLNFSTWNRYDVGERAEKWEEILEEVFEGRMPPRAYTPLHPGTRLSAAERQVLEAWARRYAQR